MARLSDKDPLGSPLRPLVRYTYHPLRPSDQDPNPDPTGIQPIRVASSHSSPLPFFLAISSTSGLRHIVKKPKQRPSHRRCLRLQEAVRCLSVGKGHRSGKKRAPVAIQGGGPSLNNTARKQSIDRHAPYPASRDRFWHFSERDNQYNNAHLEHRWVPRIKGKSWIAVILTLHSSKQS